LKLSLLPAIIGILFTDLFDSISTFIGVAHAADLLDKDGHPKNLKQGLIVDSFATLGAGVAGNVFRDGLHRERGRHQHGRAHRAHVSIHGALFSAVLLPRATRGHGPVLCNSSVLILVGASMFRSVGKISFARIEESLPAFLTIILIPLTFSITQGILWGFHFTRRPLFDRRTAPRNSSGDVCARAGFDWVIATRAREV
jgi:AGZA family xanthine/uracil permease-like MFS transporter